MSFVKVRREVEEDAARCDVPGCGAQTDNWGENSGWRWFCSYLFCPPCVRRVLTELGLAL